MDKGKMYLCQYGNCQVRLPMRETYVLGLPHGKGAHRYCSAEHVVAALRELSMYSEKVR